MFLDTPSRPKPVLFHRKAYSNCLEDAELSHRSYIILLSHFSDNLNASIRNLEDCIADLEEHPKFKISRAEKQLLECGLQYLCQLYLDRVCKESYYRNAVIRKNYNAFVQSYSIFAGRTIKQDYPRNKVFAVKSFSQNERAGQRLTLSKQTSPKLNTIGQRRQMKNSMFVTKTIAHQPKLSTSLEKHNFQGSKMFMVKKVPINTNSKKLTISSLEERKNSDSDVKGSLVYVNHSKYLDQQFECQFQKVTNNPVQSFSTSRVLAFRNRFSTNPESHEKQRGAKYGRMLRMSYMSIEGNSGNGKSKYPYQQQIKLILSIDD